MKTPKEIHAENRKPGAWDDYFHVRGGPFSGEQIMGWHITDESGYTLAVSPNHSFVEFCMEAIRLRDLLLKASARYHLGERRDQGYLDDMKPQDWEALKTILSNMKPSKTVPQP